MDYEGVRLAYMCACSCSLAGDDYNTRHLSTLNFKPSHVLDLGSVLGPDSQMMSDTTLIQVLHAHISVETITDFPFRLLLQHSQL